MLDLAGLALLWLVAREEQAPGSSADGALRHAREARPRRAGGAPRRARAGRRAGARPAAAHASLVVGRPGRRRPPRREPRRRAAHLQRARVGRPRRRARARRRRRRRCRTAPRGPRARWSRSTSQPDLPDGTYVVSYRVVSADGHPVRGGSVFGVGDGEVDTGALGRVAGRLGRPDVGGGRRGRARPRLRRRARSPPAGRRSSCSSTAAAPSGRALVRLVRVAARRRRASASLVALPVQAALGTGQGPGSLFDDGVLGEVAKDGVGLGVVLALVGLRGRDRRARPLARRSPSPAPRWRPAPSPPTATPAPGSTVALATVADVTHLWVVAVWGGGLVLLVARAARPARRGRPRRHHRASSGGSRPWRPSPIVLVGRHRRRRSRGTRCAPSTPSPAPATAGCSSPRSRWSAWVAALGAYNHFRLVPALTRGQGHRRRSPSCGPRCGSRCVTARRRSWPSPRCWWW